MLHEHPAPPLTLHGKREERATQFRRADQDRPLHILIPTNINPSERPVVQLGLRLAAAQGSKLTLLHVRPAEEQTNGLHWLDAIDTLHQAMSRPADWSPGQAGKLASERFRAAILAFVEQEIPPALLDGVDLHPEFRPGEVAQEVARYAAAQAVDLVLVGSNRPWWALPLWPSLSRRIWRLTQTQVVLVRLGAPAAAKSARPAQALPV